MMKSIPQEFEPSQELAKDSNFNLEKTDKLFLKYLFEKKFILNSKSVLGSLAYARLIINDFSLHSKAYSLCLHISSQRKSIPDRIAIYHLMKKIQKALEKSQSDSVSEFSSNSILLNVNNETNFLNFKFQLEKYIEESLSFWQNLQQENPSISLLFKQVKFLEQKKTIIESIWKKNESEFGQVPLANLVYGIFRGHFMNLPWEGGQFVKKYISSLKNINPNSFDKTESKEREYGIIMISAEKRNLGEVLLCSDTISEIFMIEKKFLIGQKVNLIMPRFFQDKHNHFLLTNYEVGQSKMLGKENFLYGKDSNHNIFPISLNLGLHLDHEKGILYIGLIKKISDNKEHILFREDGSIEETSVIFRNISSFEPYKKIHINSFFLNFDISNLNPSTDINQCNLEIENDLQIKIQYGAQILGFNDDDDDDNLKEPLKLKAKISRHLYQNESLYAMILEFKEQIGTDRKRIMSPKMLQQLDTKTLNILEDGMLKISPKNKNFKKLEIYDTVNGNTEPYSQKRLLTDKNVKNNLILSDKSLTPYHLDRPENTKTQPINLSFSEKDTSYFLKQDKLIDNIQIIFSRPYPNRFKTISTNLLVLILLTFLAMIVIQYIVLKESISEISFAINTVRTSYDRLTSLGLIWWFSYSYQTRVLGMLTSGEADLDRFKLRARTERIKIKTSNDQLSEIIATSEEYQRQKFFEKNVRFFYPNGSNSLDYREVSTFEGVNIFVEKLIMFDITPHKVVFKNGNPDLVFVIDNLANDLLISSEELAQDVKNLFENQIEAQQLRMESIFILNIIIGFFTIFLAITIFYVNNQNDVKLIKVLRSIHPQNIEFVISKLKMFNNSLRKKQNLIPQEFYNLHLDYCFSKNHLKNFSLIRADSKIKIFSMKQIKQLLFLILLICIISVISSIRQISSSGLLQEVLQTNRQVMFCSKVRYNTIVSFVTLAALLGTLNTTTMRNKPVDQQLFYNINQMPSSNIVYQELTDSSGQFTDLIIEKVLKGKPCSYVVNYPGSQNDVNCPRVTQNETIGILSLYSYFREELYGFSIQAVRNLTLSNALQIFNQFSVMSPKVTTINGGFMYMIDFLNKKLETQKSNLLQDAKTKLAFQIILVILFSLVEIWFLTKIVFDDSMARSLLKTIPFQEILKNKILKIYIKKLYRIKLELLE